MKAKARYLIIAGVLLGTALDAQIFSMGAEGELLTSSVKISNIPNSAANAVKGSNIMGYEIGPYFKFGFGNVYIKPKVLIGYQSGIVQTTYPDQSSTSVSMSVTKLDVPVLVGLKVVGPLSIEAGPVYSRLLTITNYFDGNSIDSKPDGFGYRIGANVQLGFIGLNVAYQGVKNNAMGSGTFSSFQTPDELIFGASLGF